MDHLNYFKRLILLAVFTCLSLAVMAQSSSLSIEELSKKKAEFIEKYQDNEKAAAELNKYVEAAKAAESSKAPESANQKEKETASPTVIAPSTVDTKKLREEYKLKKAELIKKYKDQDKLNEELQKLKRSIFKGNRSKNKTKGS